MAARHTLDTVAERARVSRQTVSNVLNSPHLVRPDTAQRVREVIEELGYRRSRAAQQMRTRRSMLLGLRLEPDRGGINGAVLDRFLHAVVDAAQARDYRVVLFTAADDEREIASYSELLDTGEADGFLLTSTHHGDPRTAWLAERGVPFSTFGRPWGAADQHHSWVDVDGAAGTRAAVEHLVGLGHRRIGFVGWPSGSGVGDDRRDGWRAAAGPPPCPPPTTCRRSWRTASLRAAPPPRRWSPTRIRRPRWCARATRSRSAPCPPCRRSRSPGSTTPRWPVPSASPA